MIAFRSHSLMYYISNSFCDELSSTASWANSISRLRLYHGQCEGTRGNLLYIDIRSRSIQYFQWNNL